MTRARIHITALILFTAAYIIGGVLPATCQELKMPECWETEFRQVNPIFRDDTVTIRFLGDIMMHQSQITNAYRGSSHDFSSYFRFISKDLEEADLTLANMEFALGGEPYSGYPAFSAPDEIVGYSARCGIDIFLLANNHIYDKGMAGASRTISLYKDAEEEFGTRHIGLAENEDEQSENHPYMTAVKGIRFAFINATYATNGGTRSGWPAVNYLNDTEGMLLALETARKKHSDITIVLPHWGVEYHLIHSALQEQRANMYADNGADMIIGAHPHVIQDTSSISTGRYGKVPVVYSLGNTISNMSAANTQLGMMATARIVRSGNGDIKPMPLELTFLWCSRPGGFSEESYIVIPVEEFIGRRDEWAGKWDYDNMVRTYRKVLKETGME